MLGFLAFYVRQLGFSNGLETQLLKPVPGLRGTYVNTTDVRFFCVLDESLDESLSPAGVTIVGVGGDACDFSNVAVIIFDQCGASDDTTVFRDDGVVR